MIVDGGIDADDVCPQIEYATPLHSFESKHTKNPILSSFAAVRTDLRGTTVSPRCGVIFNRREHCSALRASSSRQCPMDIPGVEAIMLPLEGTKLYALLSKRSVVLSLGSR
jgi:hypothetical protein